MTARRDGRTVDVWFSLVGFPLQLVNRCKSCFETFAMRLSSSFLSLLFLVAAMLDFVVAAPVEDIFNSGDEAQAKSGGVAPGGLASEKTYIVADLEFVGFVDSISLIILTYVHFPEYTITFLTPVFSFRFSMPN